MQPIDPLDGITDNSNPIEESRKVILVVDDNANNQKLVHTLLTKNGYKFRMALNGEAALASVRTNPPDLILLDISMPGMGGFEVCEQLKNDELTCNIPVIFISALKDQFDIVRGFDVGGVDFVTKPFKSEILLARIKTHLTLSHLYSELGKKERLALLGQLTAIVGHELRNPMGIIRNTLQTLIKLINISDTSINEKIMRIDRSITRCDNIIGKLQGITKIDNLSQQSIMLDEWLARLIEDQQIPEGITFEYNLDLPDVRLLIDPDQLQRAVINIFENACQTLVSVNEETDKKVRLKIIISTCKTSERIEVAISDNGEGITPEGLQKIFEPLYSTRTYGMGLGIPIVKQIMNLHGGGVDVDSEVGKGTEVKLWLPLSLLD